MQRGIGHMVGYLPQSLTRTSDLGPTSPLEWHLLVATKTEAHTVFEWVVCILLECCLVFMQFSANFCQIIGWYPISGVWLCKSSVAVSESVVFYSEFLFKVNTPLSSSFLDLSFLTLLSFLCWDIFYYF